MTSPNFSQYIDLTIYDVDAFQVYNDAITYARDAVPEFQPRTGTLEEAIMQAIAYNTALLSSQINRLPDGLMEGMARLAGLERLEATFATGEATFEVFDDNGFTVPAGTVIAYEQILNDIVNSFPFETVTDLIIPVGETTGTVSIIATDAGIYPALLGGQELDLISPSPGVVAVQLSSSISVGTNAETDIDYFNRSVQHFGSLSQSLVTKQQMINYIRANYPFVGAIAVFDLTNPAGALQWDDAPEPGYVTIVLTDTNGDPLGTSQITSIVDDISAKTVAGLIVDVVSPDEAGVAVEVEISVSDGYDGTETREAVDSYLTYRLSSLGYDFTGSIIKNELISGIANIIGVRYVKNITLSSTSINLVADLDGNLNFTLKNGIPVGSVEVTSS